MLVWRLLRQLAWQGSQEAVRVHIHCQSERAFGGEASEPLAQVSLHVGLARGFYQEAPAVAAAHQAQRGGRRAEDLDVAGFRGAAGDEAGEAFGLCAVAAGDDEGGKAAVRRQARLAADGHFLGEEAVAVALGERFHQRMVGEVGLDQGAAGPVAASGAAGHLGEQLPGALSGARVGGLQRQVGIDDAGKRQMGKMMALGHQLRANDEVKGAMGDVVDQGGKGLAVDEVGGQDGKAGSRPAGAGFFRQPLYPRPHGGELVLCSAGGTDDGHGL